MTTQVILDCLTFVTECDRVFKLRNSGIKYRFCINENAAAHFMQWENLSYEQQNKMIDGDWSGITINGHPVERIHSRHLIQLSVMPNQGGVLV